MNELTTERLAEIKGYCAKATAGPWQVEMGLGAGRVPMGHSVISVKRREPPIDWIPRLWLRCEDGCGTLELEDARFIANTRTDLPLLVAEVERLSGAADILARHTQAIVDQRDKAQSDLSAAQKRIKELEQLEERAHFREVTDKAVLERLSDELSRIKEEYRKACMELGHPSLTPPTTP